VCSVSNISVRFSNPLTCVPISLDDKLFSFWLLQGDSYPFARVKGIFRFETGIKVTEFRDLRANPRCLLESQILSFRVKWSQLISTGVLGSSRKTGVSPTPPVPGRSSNALSSLGVPFDPYDYAPLPSRILATGAAANFPSVSNLVGDVFNAPVFVPLSQVDSAQVVPHRNAPAQGYPSRASLGGAYVARWVWGREWGSGGLGVFEDEMKRLLGKRWVATGGSLLRTNVNGATSAVGLGVLGGGSGANSGTSTPYGHPGGRSTLGNTVFPEEEEDEALELERNGQFGGSSSGVNPGVIGSGVYGISGSGGGGTYGESTMRLRTQTGSTTDTHSSITSSGMVPSTALTTPDIGTNGSAGTSSVPTPLTPVVALATSDAEAQIGLAKVAEPDVDAFLTYAAIVPEYYRLEGMLIKGIV
jgi:xylulokinase